MYVYKYIYIYICIERERERSSGCACFSIVRGVGSPSRSRAQTRTGFYRLIPPSTAGAHRDRDPPSQRSGRPASKLLAVMAGDLLAERPMTLRRKNKRHAVAHR